jgi:hypothetical protein
MSVHRHHTLAETRARDQTTRASSAASEVSTFKTGLNRAVELNSSSEWPVRAESLALVGQLPIAAPKCSPVTGRSWISGAPIIWGCAQGRELSVTAQCGGVRAAQVIARHRNQLAHLSRVSMPNELSVYVGHERAVSDEGDYICDPGILTCCPPIGAAQQDRQRAPQTGKSNCGGPGRASI